MKRERSSKKRLSYTADKYVRLFAKACGHCRPGTTGWNAILNLGTYVAQFGATLICVPFLIRGLGTERVGVLTLVWAIAGYFSVLDLGLGRATTQSVSRLLASNDAERIPGVFWSAATVQAVMGTLGALFITALIPWLVGSVLQIPSALASEARVSLILCAASLPFVLVNSSLIGLLQAARRFDLSNCITGPAAVATQVVPAIIATRSANLGIVVFGILATRIVVCLTSFFLCRSVYPGLSSRRRCQRHEVISLIKFGGWVTISSLTSPIINYADRFVIGSFLALSSVTYYSIPYEAGARLTLISVSLASALFPMFASASTRRDDFRTAQLASSAMSIYLGPVNFLATMLFLFGEELMVLWLGPEMGRQSGPVLRTVAVGAFMNSVAGVPYGAIQAMGRPDVTAKLHMLELPLMLALLWYAVGRWGVSGAAAVYVFRTSADLLLLCIVMMQLFGPAVRRVIFFQYLAGVLLFVAQLIVLGALRLTFGSGVLCGFATILLAIFVATVGRAWICSQGRELAPAASVSECS